MIRRHYPLFVISILGAFLTACAAPPPNGTEEVESAAPAPSGVVFSDGAATGVINEIHPPYGNLDTAFTQEDLIELGLVEGDSFEVEANGNTLIVLWATTYEDVPEGDGVAFLNWEDKLRIARNHANAADTLRVSVGDTITIRPVREPGN